VGGGKLHVAKESSGVVVARAVREESSAMLSRARTRTGVGAVRVLDKGHTMSKGVEMGGDSVCPGQ
jgi:hypothetical protein